MRSTRHILLAFGVVGLVSLTACADPPEPGHGGPTGPGSTEPTGPGSGPTGSWNTGINEEDDFDAPPPVTVRSGDRSIDLTAWTFCFGNLCADGIPPADPPDVGSPEEVTVEFPLTGWSFTASFVPADKNECGRVQRGPLMETGDGSFVLRPIGHADTYDVTLFGQGNGDLFVTFRWTTPIDGRSETESLPSHSSGVHRAC